MIACSGSPINVTVNVFHYISLVKMNAMTLMTSIVMVLVLMDTKIMCGNVIINAYLEMSLVKMNAILLTSTAMVLVLMD
jgi:hypothetical protein